MKLKTPTVYPSTTFLRTVLLTVTRRFYGESGQQSPVKGIALISQAQRRVSLICVLFHEIKNRSN